MREGQESTRLTAMVIHLSTWRQGSSNAFGRKRDALLLWLLARHPATAGMLTELGLFGSKDRAAKRLRKLCARKRLRLAGTIALKGGRPEHVFCRGVKGVKGDNLEHEVQVSRLCFKIHADEVKRSEGEVDPFLRPDAEILIDGQRFLLEYDSGATGYEALIEKRFTKYRSCRDLVLWVCASEARMEGLRRRAEMIRGTALFTTLDQALRDPHSSIWVDVDGERASLPRSRKGSPNR